MNELTSFIDRYKASNPTGWRKWIVGFFVIVAIVVVTAVAAVAASVRGSQIATLQTQRDAVDEARNQAVANAALTTDATAQEQHLQSAEVARQQIVAINTQLQVLQQQHKASRDIINNIHSWGDVDRVVK